MEITGCLASETLYLHVRVGQGWAEENHEEFCRK